jgi:uncharacterized protein (TIGR00730 family)
MTSIISVFGSSAPKLGSTEYEDSRAVGKLLAQAGFAVQTGGYSGVMAAASQGANEAGGHVIGITSSQIETYRPLAPNQWVKQEIKYPTLRERLLHLVLDCAGCIVMPGGIGTLSEMALIWSFMQVGEIEARPIILVGDLWQRTITAFLSDHVRPEHRAFLTFSNTPSEAVIQLTQQLNR